MKKPMGRALSLSLDSRGKIDRTEVLILPGRGAHEPQGLDLIYSRTPDSAGG